MRATLSAALAIVLTSAVAAGTGPASATGVGEAGQAAGGPQPRVLNGRLAPEAAGAGLGATFHRLVAAQSEPAWIGYSVPAVASGERRLCCAGDTWISDGIVFTNGRLATCGLEPGDRAARTSQGQPIPNQGPIRLEGPETLVVLYRVEEKAVQRIRIFSPDCELDAGGRTIHWLEGVNGADSVTLLRTFVSKAELKSDKLTDAAISAIAMHKDEAADAALERLAVSADNPEFVRKKVTFWMGNARGRRGFDAVKRIARDDPSEEVRKSAMFGLSQSRDDQAIPELVRFARQDASPKVRGEAIFWLAQKAGQRAAAEITSAIENDPDTDVKKRAVFALSQLPKDEGIPLLIKLAKTNQNPAVRKQAMFWLGQSRDPRALDFFADVLAK
jgi:HEAT repeat protein